MKDPSSGTADVPVGSACSRSEKKNADGDVGGPGALVCTHATFRFAMEKLGAEAFDDRLIVVDEFHHKGMEVGLFDTALTEEALKATFEALAEE